MIRVKIVPNDSRKVAKVVIISDDMVLMMKRSNYVEKYAGEWDLPGGHIKVGEALEAGMAREVKEETGLRIENPVFIQDIDNLSFFYCEYDNEPIKLSHEHTAFRFFRAKNLNPNTKFEKIALKALEMYND